LGTFICLHPRILGLEVDDVSQLIDIKELARRLSLARGTLYNWVHERRIPYRKLGRALRFDPDEIDRMFPRTPRSEGEK
jgi:excisionase family DNA binding protein